MPDLEKCPFCGSDVIIVNYNHYGSFQCTENSSCHGTGLYTFFELDQRENAILQWNKRAK